MTVPAGKAPKKVKEKKQSPEERLEAMRYNHMMYGPTDGEIKMMPKKVDFGASYLKHPKFQSLMTAFKRGVEFKFDIAAGGKLFTISTDGSHISFNGKTIFYARPLNKHEDNLFLDRVSTVQHQSNDAVVHLVFAVHRSFPDLGDSLLAYQHKKFYFGNEALETNVLEPGSNILLGTYKHSKVH